MITLKSYHIHYLEAQIKQTQKNYIRLRELIKLGDMQAVEELSNLKKNIFTLRNKIAHYQQKFNNTQIDVFLFALSTVLDTLLDTHQKICPIKEELIALPWKKEASCCNQNLNISKKNSTSQILDISRTKRGHSHSKDRLFKSVGEKNIASKDPTTSIEQPSKRKRNGKHKKNDQQSTVQKSINSRKDMAQSKKNTEVKQRSIDPQSKKNTVQSHSSLEKLLTIKIGAQEFEEILKLKNVFLPSFEISFCPCKKQR